MKNFRWSEKSRWVLLAGLAVGTAAFFFGRSATSARNDAPQKNGSQKNGPQNNRSGSNRAVSPRDKINSRRASRPSVSAARPRRETSFPGVYSLPQLLAAEKTADSHVAALRRKLQFRFTREFKNATLLEALQFLSDNGRQFNLILDEQALEEEGILTDTMIDDVFFRDTTLATALHRILEPRQLTWTIHHEAVFVTTATKAEEILIQRIYPVGHLVEPATPDEKRHLFFFGTQFPADGAVPSVVSRSSESRLEWLKTVIQSVTSGPWFEADGIGGTLSLRGENLIVRQREKVHAEIKELLRGLTLAVRGELHGGVFFIRRPGYPYEKDRSVLRRLSQTVSVDFRETPLPAVLRELEKQTGLVFSLDGTALAEEGIETDAPITLKLSRVTLHSVLRHLLDPRPLEYIVEGGTVVLTTSTSAEEKLVGAVYDIRDLISAKTDVSPRASELINLLMTETSGPWLDIDGVGGNIEARTLSGLLFVQQTRKVHVEIARILHRLREERQRQPTNSTPPSSSPSTKKTAGKQPASAAGENTTRFYTVDTPERAKELAKILPRFVVPGSWQKGRGEIGVTQRTLVIRQSAAVHRRITEFLRRLEGPRAEASAGNLGGVSFSGFGGGNPPF